MWKYILLSILMLIYVIFASVMIVNNSKKKKALEHLKKKNVFLTFYEKKIIELLNIPSSKIKVFIYTIRFLLLVALIFMATIMGFVTLFLVLSVLTVLYFNMQTSKLVDKTGVTHLATINSFLDTFIPSIASGLSNDQSMLKFVHSTEDANLTDWWLKKDDLTSVVKLDNKWTRIVEVYNMMNFIEEKGTGDPLSIIKEMQNDLNTKQKYYDEYRAKMGEIKPIMLSYYIGVPLLIVMSYNQTRGFWNTGWGLVAAIGLAILFAIFQFLIYKLKKDSINMLF